MDHTFDPDLIHAIFKLKWNKKALERQKNENTGNLDGEVVAGTSKKNRPTSANANALKLSSELLRSLSQKLFNVLLLLLKQRVLVKYKQLILKGFFHSYC